MEKLDLFYVRPSDVRGDILFLQNDEGHHLMHVHRNKVGGTFLAADGIGKVYECEIVNWSGDILKSRILKQYIRLGEPNFQLTLAIALPKKDRFEWIVEKGTELGVSRFIPLISKRTIVQGKTIKMNRCQKITLAAMKQCRRCVLPIVEKPAKFESFCNYHDEFDYKFLAHEKILDCGLDDILSEINGKHKNKTGILCIGPEGGFAQEEVDLAVKNGFSIIGLGPRRLRTETAALVGATLILDKLSELK